MRGKLGNRFLSLLLALCLMASLVLTVTPASAEPTTHTLVSGIKSASDDMEELIRGGEEGAGNMDASSSDIEIGVQEPGQAETVPQYVGLRFADLTIPQGATITGAYIQFTVDENKNGNPFNVDIVAEDVDNAPTFTVAQYDISSRYASHSTASSVNWTLAGDGSTDWLNENDATPLQRTPDISSLVQAVVGRTGWASGNAMSFIMVGGGCRTAISYEKNAAKAAVLHVDYTYDGGNVDQAAPESLLGVAPTTDANNDGMITGTTAAMEYKLSSASEESYAVCSDSATTGLASGSYDVRYAAAEGYNASPATTVTVPAYVPVVYEATDITFQPGANESIMNFTWYSNVMSSAQSMVQVALKSAMTGSDFPEASAMSFTGTIVNSNGFKSNEVSVTGLTANTEFVYRLGDGTSFGDVYSFKTHDLTSGYSAILVGDPQIGSGGTLHGMEGWQNTVEQALTSFPGTSFILSAGDQVNTSTNEDEYAGFFSPEELTSIPVIPAVGNHDNSSLYASHYNSPNESTTYGTTSAGGDYWFTYGSTLYMVLNSNNSSAASHEAFMQEAINAAGTGIVWKIVMFHHSIYSSASHSTDSYITDLRAALYPVFDNLDIDVVLQGHDHVYTRTFQMEGGVAQNTVESSVVNPNGTLYITANSGSGSKYYNFKSADTAYAAVRWQGYEPSYSNIAVTDSSFTITTYKSESGGVIDTYTITKDQSGAPSGLTAVMPTTAENNDGQIAGTTAAMEYKLSTEKTWTACTADATIGLVPGTYDVRYAAGSGDPSVSTIVIIEAHYVETQDQDAPTGLAGVTATTMDNNDGQITGTTDDMEYKLSLSTNWTACTGTSATGLVPGSYEVRYAEKTGYNASPATAVEVPAYAADGETAIVSRIGNALDDMEERPDKSLDWDSSDLEITWEKDDNNQLIGLRFADLQIPEGATITDAYIQFSVDEDDKSTDSFDINIHTDDTANSNPFENKNGTVSERTQSVSGVNWKDAPSWTVEHAAGLKQRTSDLSSLVQEIVDKDGWTAGNAISFILNGNGDSYSRRSAESFEGAGGHAEQIPTLYLSYTTGAGETGDNTVDFAVLSTTDEHGKCWDTNVLTGGSVSNSLLKVSSAVESIRDTYGDDNVVLIDNGDTYQGTPVSAYHIAQLTRYLATGSTAGLSEHFVYGDTFNTITPMALSLKYIGYDAAVLGNHEFNYDWDAMSSIYDYLESDGTYDSVSVLAANLYNADGTNAFTPYITKDITVGDQTFKIGILGLENTDCTRWDVAENYPGITFASDSTAEVEKYIPLMQAEGCDFIILSYHSGMGSISGDLTFGVNTESQIARVIANTDGVDMVIAGHDHSTGYTNNTYKNASNEDVLVVNGGGNQLTESVFTATLNDDDSISVTLKNSRNVSLSSYDNDATLKNLIAPYAAAASDYVNQDVGTLTGSWDSVTNFYLQQSDTIDLINRAQIAEGGKYMAEKYDTADKLQALYDATGLDHITVDMSATSVVVNGNYTASAGQLSMKNIYQMYRYDNTLYLLALTGQEIKDILEFNAENRLSASVSNGSVSYTTIGDDFTNPIFYGLDFQYDMAQDAGERVVITGFDNGNAFDLNKTYVFAVNNYHLGNGPFADYSTTDAIWSQTDDLGGGVVQDLIAGYVSDETTANGGVSPDPASWELTYSGSLEGDEIDAAYIAYPSTEAPADGETILIYYNDGGTVISNTATTGYKGSDVLATADVTLENNVLYADNTAAAFEVSYDSGTGYYTFTSDGKYLTAGATGNSLTLEDTLDASNCSYWTLETTDGGWRVHNVGAAYSGNHNQYLEYYSGGFTTYGITGSTEKYVYNFYTVIPAATLMTETPADGDQFVIWYNAGSQIISSAPIQAGGRLDGIDSATAGELLPVFEGSAVFTAHYNDTTGYYTFTSDGKYLTSGQTGNTLSLTDSPDGDCSLWEVSATDGGWLVRNVGAAYNDNHNQYLEYYHGFTTYGLSTSKLSVYTYNFYAFNGFAPEAPSDNEDQAAPTGLTGVAPTTASNNDGQITGTTTAMEYKLSADAYWTACSGDSITGLLPGSYEVRFAAKTGYNASPSTTVTVTGYGSSSYSVKDLTFQYGSDETSMNFTWYFSSEAQTAQVQIALKSAMTGDTFPVSAATTFDGTAAASGSFLSGKASVTGLTADTEYVYRVGDGTSFSEVYSFKTHDTASYSAILVGDPQIGSGGYLNGMDGWQDTVTEALTAYPNTSFIISAGDQVNTSTNEEEYDGFFSPEELTSMPLIPAVGNHDNNALYSYHYNSPNESETYGTTSAGGDYWFTYGSTLYMVLNSNNQSAASHDAFMQEAISAAGDGITWTVVMFHHSIYSSASHSTDGDILSRRSDLYPVFDKYDIDVVLMGHDHCYTRTYIMKGGAAMTDDTQGSSVTNPDGTLYITANTGSGSKYYDMKTADTAYSAVHWQGYAPSYSAVEVTEDSFTITTYKVSDGSVIDTFTINKASVSTAVVTARDALVTEMNTGKYTTASVSAAQLVVDSADAAITDGTSVAREAELLAALANAKNALVLINQAKLEVAPNTILGSDRTITFRVSVDQLQNVDVMEGFVKISDDRFRILSIESLYSDSSFIFTQNPNYSGDGLTGYFSLAQIGGFDDTAKLDVVDITIKLKNGMTADSLEAALDSVTMYIGNSDTHTSVEVYCAVTGDGTAATNIWRPSDVKGDVDGDGLLKGNDLSLAMTYFGAANSDTDWYTSGAWMVDYNSDGVIDIGDLMAQACLIAKLKIV